MKNIAVAFAFAAFFSMQAAAQTPADTLRPLALTPNYDLWAFKRHYLMDVFLNGQHLKMEMTREVISRENNWVVQSDIISDLIRLTDTTSMEKNTLRPARQATFQGANKTVIEFTPVRIAGFSETAGRRREIDTALTEPLTSGGPVADLVIGACSLKEGVVYGYKIFDTQSLAVKKYRLKIVRRETVVVPAGSYETVVVETAAEDGNGGSATYWMSNGIAVKTRALGSEAVGGAMIVTELTR